MLNRLIFRVSKTRFKKKVWYVKGQGEFDRFITGNVKISAGIENNSRTSDEAQVFQ
jgi:hypothetical protein